MLFLFTKHSLCITKPTVQNGMTFICQWSCCMHSTKQPQIYKELHQAFHFHNTHFMEDDVLEMYEIVSNSRGAKSMWERGTIDGGFQLHLSVDFITAPGLSLHWPLQHTSQRLLIIHWVLGWAVLLTAAGSLAWHCQENPLPQCLRLWGPTRGLSVCHVIVYQSCRHQRTLLFTPL